jgi:hypothetical protein
MARGIEGEKSVSQCQERRECQECQTSNIEHPTPNIEYYGWGDS